MDVPIINQADTKALETIVEPIKRERKPKMNRMMLEKAFPAEYIKQGLNGTQAYKALKPRIKLANARQQASLLIAKPHIQKSIEALLPSEEKTMSVLSDVYEAEREGKITFKDLHKFWETDLKLRGKLKDKETSGVSIAMQFNTTPHDSAKPPLE